MSNARAIAGLRHARDDAVDVLRADLNRRILELELALKTAQQKARIAESLVRFRVLKICLESILTSFFCVIVEESCGHVLGRRA